LRVDQNASIDDDRGIVDEIPLNHLKEAVLSSRASQNLLLLSIVLSTPKKQSQTQLLHKTSNNTDAANIMIGKILLKVD
jgi:hypothetical protein